MRAAFLLLLLGVPAGAHAAAELKAGIARVEITPSGSMAMYGYANRKCGPANGTHDPLFAKVLVLEAGGSRVAIVTADLGSLVSDNLRREVAARLDIPVLLLSASHTHSAPAFLPFGSAPATGEEARAYLAGIERRIFAAIEEASRSMFPARLGIGRGSLQLGYNRLLVREDGRARAVFDNLERIPYGPVDPEVVLLRVEDAEGRARALLVHYAAHPVVLGRTSCKYSADYPGVLQAIVERELPGTQVMFVQGGAGDINPLFQGRSGREEDDFGVMEKMGQLLAAEVLRASTTVVPLAPVVDPINVRSETLTFADRWEKDGTIEVGITTILVGREVAIAAVPGEPFHKLQRTWKEQADVPHPLFYGYTLSAGGTWPGYIPDLRSAAYGGYGADASTRIEVGAGERIMQRHLIALYDLLGMWKDKPGRP
ncbi:MAG TPA: neutral/alkaline non-lysosomal ceramidase N-terminal domain-containing protein [Vicinamibacterales bacterium]|nr:neutral/alkaline non-lysosomal ceramidase N-terminal domain-containing protein [Vicinamibacterales bacterium]